MIVNLPAYVSAIFGFTTFATVILFVWAIKNSAAEQTQKKAMPIFIGLVIWLVIQMLFSLTNLYNTNTNSFPPKILMAGVLPPLFTIMLLFATAKGRKFIDTLPLKNLTYLHTIRMPVELVLYWHFLAKSIPELMTFEGRNFDFISGLTAPIVAYLVFTKQKLSRNVLLIWNFLCLGLLLNIVLNALLAAPSPIQQFAFEQPNVAILNFPFSWLPTVIVPIVLFAHLASIRQLLQLQVKVTSYL